MAGSIPEPVTPVQEGNNAPSSTQGGKHLPGGWRDGRRFAAGALDVDMHEVADSRDHFLVIAKQSDLVTYAGGAKSGDAHARVRRVMVRVSCVRCSGGGIVVGSSQQQFLHRRGQHVGGFGLEFACIVAHVQNQLALVGADGIE